MQIDKQVQDMLDRERRREMRLAEQREKQSRPWWTQTHPLNIPWWKHYRDERSKYVWIFKGAEDR
jgi:hypothetical protein